ncbi:MAG: site-specific integrase, partial [Planctomycetota bacterium]|nr:site-specific integrase [Planctomycetota bacterium]
MKGSIRKTGENKWRLVFDLDRGIDGKRRQKVKRFSGNKKGAEKKLRDTIREYEEGNYIDPSEQTLGEFLD